MTTPQEVLAFWIDEVGPTGWFKSDEAIDAKIRENFLPIWTEASEGGLGFWLTCPSETLAYVILLDQFSRNMFRGSGEAFAMDEHARAAAKMAIDRRWDLRIDEPARLFFYMPLTHSENLCDQDRAVRLIHTRMPQGGANSINDAQAHREIIRQFGRFPYRNAALKRQMKPAEQAFIDAGGYGKVLREIKSQRQVSA